ncbi:hypothetical protein A6D6_02704 [Alcanivorax xiamenensis]|uniref:Uncharacterized protein n=1 Tax=Alcanivorax xiamenensis TaxID=1177156 RepID=A0ABQ6Y6F2_9GAMM|nr:hypothetical protein [Alcanivorax xiamenensis]KAF0804940.1 hypothetical protein A6D6_02704 [Alcanivorax xiamenensis]
MSNLFFQLPFAVPNSALPVIPSGDIEPLTPYEIGADDHWIFGDSAASLTGQVSGRQLTAFGDAPSFSSNYLTIPGGSGQGLESGIEEIATQADTICAVLRVTPNSVTQPLFGGLADGTANHGGGPFLDSVESKIWLTYRGTTISSTDTGDAPVPGQWFFLAVSRDFTSGIKSARSLMGGSYVFETAGTGTYSPTVAPRSIALGNPYLSANNAPLDCAEFIVLPRSMDDGELQALYARRQAVMAARGIAI